jgi:hypothetical protein
MLEHCTPSLERSLFDLDFEAMDAQIMWQEDTPFECGSNSFSLLLGIEWELLIIHI